MRRRRKSRPARGRRASPRRQAGLVPPLPRQRGKTTAGHHLFARSHCTTRADAAGGRGREHHRTAARLAAAAADNPLGCIVTGLQHGGTTVTSELIMTAPVWLGPFETGFLHAARPAEFPGVRPFAEWAQATDSSSLELNGSKWTALVGQPTFRDMYAYALRESPLLRNTTRFVDKTPSYSEKLEQVMRRAPQGGNPPRHRREGAVKFEFSRRRAGRFPSYSYTKRAPRRINRTSTTGTLTRRLSSGRGAPSCDASTSRDAMPASTPSPTRTSWSTANPRSSVRSSPSSACRASGRTLAGGLSPPSGRGATSAAACTPRPSGSTRPWDLLASRKD